MLDLLFAVLALRALGASLKGRFVLGIVSAFAAAAAFSIIVAAGWYGRLFDELGGSGVLLLVVFGPSSLPGTIAHVPVSSLAAAHPALWKIGISAILLVPYGVLTKRAKRHPLHEDASFENDLALRFVAPALVGIAMPIVFAFAEALTPAL